MFKGIYISACESSPFSKEVGNLPLFCTQSVAFSGDFFKSQNIQAWGTPEATYSNIPIL